MRSTHGDIHALQAKLSAAESERDAAKADSERLDWLEDLFSITSNESKTWREFMTLVTEKGYRKAIDSSRAARSTVRGCEAK